MAYNPANETQEELCQLEKNSRGEYIRICDVRDNKSGNSSVDIRTMYTDASGEIRPTTKGVRVPKKLVGDVVVALMSCLTAEEKEKIESEVYDLMGLEITE